MHHTGPYLFTSLRLGFREWREADLTPMAAINAHPEVMQYFPATQTLAETAAFIERMQKMFGERGYCYFAVDLLATGSLIGFIGLAWQTYEAPFTPCTDIGWRLARQHWGHGYATEGAHACLAYAFDTCGVTTVHAVAPAANLPSIHVMEKLGMQRIMSFAHPLLLHNERLKDCVLYSISALLQ